MRKLIAIVLLVAVLVNTAFASSYTISDLSSEARDYYIRNALGVQTSLNTQSYSSSLFTPLLGRSYVGSSSSYGKTVTDWIPFYGPAEIDKRTFLEIAGADDILKAYDEAEKECAKKRNTGAVLIGVGVTTMVASTITALVPVFYDMDLDSNMSNILFLSGLAGVCVSAIPLCFGIEFVLAKPNNNLSVEFAIGIADNYNQKLIDKLMAK